MKDLIPQNIKNVYHLAQALLANIIYGFPSRKIRIIGITGTNGKTTTTQMISNILEEAGKKIAVASTINFKIGKEERVNSTKYTTLSSFKTQKFIKEAVDSGCEYLVLETSSHSLDQFRVWGVKYDTAVITNVTREHLDYHGTIENYRKVKEKLFETVARSGGTVVINLDMEKPEDFLAYADGKSFAYTVKNSKLFDFFNDEIKIVRATDISIGSGGSSFHAEKTAFKLNLPGEFNIENALAAICVGISEGIDMEIISNALEKIKNVPGRFQYIPNEKGLNIIVDYAVTPDSLEKLYALVKRIAEKSKIIAVFGSCGERDRGKRPIMGQIVSKKADYILLTNEDPYREDPQRIIDEVAEGVKGKTEGKNFWKILDRRAAIKKALELAKRNDFVIITGKGAEETMAVGNKKIPWNDSRVIQEELKKI